MKIAIAATFTAEPLRDSLAFWSEKLHWQGELEFALYNQVFQELLNPASLLGSNHSGFNVVLVRPEDWQQEAHPAEASTSERRKVIESAREFARAVRTAAARSSVPYLICVCPASPQHIPQMQEAENLIINELERCPGVHLLRSCEIDGKYPVSEYYDADRDELGHVPYTAEYFVALGTTLARRIAALQRTPYKVIVVDCDETLWKGVCAEVGAQEVEVDAGHRAFQEFIVERQASGMLLCLCSKNAEEDVDEVFRCQAMPLRREHVIARRINWQPKSQNLRELASELQLGLDSFIFIDDNPLECEQVRAACPEVLTLQLPPSEDIPGFIRNLWAFDRQNVTEEDLRRTELYRENQEREQFRQQAPTLDSFLEGLQLNVTITSLSLEEVPRFSQLTQRTNQFNFTTRRRSEEETHQLLQSRLSECLAVRVSDRFGDYGLVGAIIVEAENDALRVDTFLLSCRVLGRGVEHAMLRHLGELAISRGLARIDVEFIESKRNAPAQAFLRSIAGAFEESAEQHIVFRIPAAYAAELSATKVAATSQAAAEITEHQSENSAKSAVSAPSELMQEIANGLRDIKSITEAIRRSRGISERQPAKQNPYEEMVIAAWSEVLACGEIGSDDDFFALGGDSLLATQVVSRLRQVSGVRIHLGDLFDHPTVAGLAALVSKAKCEQDREAATVRANSAPNLAHIPRRTTQGPCALSFSQQRWWFLNQWAPGTADHLSLVLRVKGILNRQALQLAFDYLVARHEVLRTNYVLVEGSPVQVVSPATSVPMGLVSLATVAENEREIEAGNILNRQFRQGFDLSHGLKLRVMLLEFAPEDHAVVVVMHHIVSDGWSRGILLRELEAAYNAFARGQEPALAKPPLQYADFAAWQREQLDQGKLDEQLAYWKQQLADAPAFLQLPADHARPSVPDLREGVHTRVLPKELLSKLHSLGQAEGATLFMVLLAAFHTFLYRYSGQHDIVVGSPVAGRNQRETEGLVGCFINMVVFRAQVDDEVTFRRLLITIRRTALEAQERQDVPFEKLVEELEHGRDMSRAPIFQAVFALENLLSTPQLDGLSAQLQEVETRSAFHDISLFAAEQTVGLRLRFEYRTDLFDPATIERMADHFENLLAALAADAEQSVGRLSLLGAAERRELLSRWNDAREYPVKSCIQLLFEEQAARFPAKTALVFEDQRMTYAELNARANQLAQYLMRSGVGPEVRVGLCMPRSLDLVIAILAILKAGGAYLPLDPSYPKDRLAFMVNDAKPPVVITQYDLKEILPDINGQVLALDAEWPEIEREAKQNFHCPAQPENLAYVIYTSGSTGRPKGCQITHANVVRLFSATEESFHFNEHDVWTMFHSYAFDFSVWELWGALTYGGKLVIVPHLVSRSPEDFYQLLADQRVTVLNQTPSSFRQLMQVEQGSGSPARLCLRYVIFGGEALEMQSLAPWFARHGDREPQLVNMYGITETTVHVTYRPLSQHDAAGGSVIGRPIPDLQLYLLDRHLQPVPIGVPGEIFVGGAGVARGYLNRPELNRERFVDDVFAPGENRRLYKSGDQARRLANGDIEYLGRIDQQVKIRGFRIELGEIESVLTQHPGVRESVVQVDDSGSGEKRLVAYVVPQNSRVPQHNDLFSFLKGRLPEYMVPAAFVPIDHIPLTSNGKIDRRALPAPDFSHSAAMGSVEARTPLEREVAKAWKQVLGLETVSVHENFFEIGGHSLLATRVIILLREKLGVTFSLRLLFENPTVAGMARALIEPLIEHTDENELTSIINAVERLTDDAARKMLAAESKMKEQASVASDAGS